MSHSISLSWEPLFLSTFERQEARSLPQDHHCHVDNAAKVEEDGLYGHIYTHLDSTGHQGPAYAVEAAVMDPSGEEKLLGATFIVPTQEPSSPIKSFRAEWNDSLQVYIVRGNPAIDDEEARAAQVADLLKPEPFSWADDVEDNILEDTAASPANGQGNYGGSGPLIVDSSNVTASNPAEEYKARKRELLDKWGVVADEFSWRNDRVLQAESQGWNIHHFNWLGYEVYEYSATPAAVSLWLILSKPKVLRPRDEVRLGVILGRAAEYIDPVVYMGNPADLQRTGQGLVNAVTGQVFKFYTPHGVWMYDQRDREEATEVDQASIDIYAFPNWVVANGFVANPMVETRFQRPIFENTDTDRDPAKKPWSYWIALGENKARRIAAKKQYNVWVPSRLRVSMRVDDQDSEEPERSPTSCSGSCQSEESGRNVSTATSCSMDTEISDKPSQGSGAASLQDKKTREIVERIRSALDNFENLGQAKDDSSSDRSSSPRTDHHEAHDEADTDEWDLCLDVEVEDEYIAMEAGVDGDPDYDDILADYHIISGTAEPARHKSLDECCTTSDRSSPAHLRHSRTFSDLRSQYSKIVFTPFVVPQRDHEASYGEDARDITPGEAPELQIPRKRGRCFDNICGDESGVGENCIAEWPVTVQPDDEDPHNVSQATVCRHGIKDLESAASVAVESQGSSNDSNEQPSKEVRNRRGRMALKRFSHKLSWGRAVRKNAPSTSSSTSTGSSASRVPSASDMSPQPQAARYFSFPEPVFASVEPDSKTSRLGREFWQRITRRISSNLHIKKKSSSKDSPLSPSAEMVAPLLPRAQAEPLQEERQGGSEQSQPQEKRKRPFRKIVTELLLDGLSLMGEYPAAF